MRAGRRMGEGGRVDEVELQGGFVTAVVRVGETVRRQPAERAEFVHELLELLEQQGWSGAPRFLGFDDEGREVLGFIDGYVAWDAQRRPATSSEDSLRSVGRLVREFHDLTAGTSLAGDQEVVCHNDLSPKNTVYADDGARAIAFIDWDIAAPGRRIHDLAFICWQYSDLGHPDAQHVATQWRILCEAYGAAPSIDLSELLPTVLWWQERTWRGIESAAAAGDSAMTRLHALGVPAAIRQIQTWTTTNSAVLESAAEGG